MPLKYRRVHFDVDKESLAGCFVTPWNGDLGQMLFLHGGKLATKDYTLPVALTLAEEYAITSFLFDFSGHGASTGTGSEATLRRRVEEAKAALTFSGFAEPVAIFGFSRGAHVAIELLAHTQVKTLILFAPALYPSTVYDVPFGDPLFESTVQANKSEESLSLLQPLKRFQGRLLIVVGENDEVVPRRVLKSLMRSATSTADNRLVVIPDGPHRMLHSLLSNDQLFADVCATIYRYVT